MKKTIFFIFFTSFFALPIQAETESELLKLEALARSQPVLAIAQSILQAYPEVEKETIADAFQKANNKTNDPENQKEKESNKDKEKKKSIAESFYDYYTKEIIEPSEYERKKRAYKIVNAAEIKYPEPWMHNAIINNNVWQDLNLFYGSADHPQIFLGNILTKNKTKTEVGKAVFNSIIARPTDNVALIHNRQAIVRTLISNKGLNTKLASLLNICREHEHMLTGLWGKEQIMQFIQSDCYLQSPWNKLDSIVEWCNKNALFMDSRELYGRTTSILKRFAHLGWCSLFVACVTEQIAGKHIPSIPFLSSLPGWEWLKLTKQDRATSAHNSIKSQMLWQAQFAAAYALLTALPNKPYIGNATGGAMAAYDLPKMWDWMKVHYWYEDFFLRRMTRIIEYLRTAQACTKIIPEAVQKNLSFFKAINYFFEDLYIENDDVAEFIDMMDSSTFDPSNLDPDRFNLFFRSGKLWAAFKILDNIKEHIEPMIAAMGELDAYMTLAHIMEQQNGNWSFIQFTNEETPSVHAEQFWHPFLDPQTVVTNSLFLGQKYQTPHIIVTGPNSGGKSTALKAVALLLVLGQSIGIVPAEQCALTPFSHLALYMNINDSIVDKESRFQKEGRQAFAHGDLIKEMGIHNKLSLAIFDEVFSGTSPKEGAEWGYKTALGYGKYPNCLCVIATHFELLTHLQKDTNNHFINYKVSIATDEHGNYLKDEQNRLIRTYTIEPGKADQHIAKEVLQEQGITSPFFKENFLN